MSVFSVSLLTPALLVGLLASLLSLAAPLPQIARAVRSRSVEGVSWGSLVLSLMTFTLWVVYGFAVADTIQVINNTLALVLLCVFGAMVIRTRAARAYLTVALALFGSAALAILVVEHANSLTLALVGTVVSTLRLVPQARLAVSGAPLWGLCPWSTLLGWVGLVVWTAYGVLARDPGLTACCALATALQTAIVVHRLPLRRTLASLAGGRLGARVARAAAPAAARLPYRGGYDLAA